MQRSVLYLQWLIQYVTPTCIWGSCLTAHPAVYRWNWWIPSNRDTPSANQFLERRPLARERGIKYIHRTCCQEFVSFLEGCPLYRMPFLITQRWTTVHGIGGMVCRHSKLVDIHWDPAKTMQFNLRWWAVKGKRKRKKSLWQTEDLAAANRHIAW